MRLTLKTGPAWPREPSLAEQLEASLARIDVLQELCVDPASLPSSEDLAATHEQLDELLWQQKWKR